MHSVLERSREAALHASGNEPERIATSKLATFAEQTILAFHQTQRAGHPPIEFFYRIGDQVIQLCFTTPRMAALLTPALAHLAIPPVASPALTVYLWDSASTGIVLPAIPTDLQRAVEGPNVWGVHAHTPSLHTFWQPAHQVLSLLDTSRKVAVYWTENAHHLPIYEGGAPLLLIFHWWLSLQGERVVHAAAVGTAAGAALLVGKSGSGKSNTALRCLHDGLLYLGDDYCLLGAESSPTVYSLYSSGKLHTPDVARFPRLQVALNQATYAYADKQLYFLHEIFRPQITQRLPLRAVLLPELTGQRDTQLFPASPAQALVAIAPSTTFQLPGATTRTIRQISDVLRKVPSYRLALGTDRAQIPDVVRQLLERLAAERAAVE